MRNLFEKYKSLSIGVFGDYCLDEYLWIDSRLNEPSLETGLIAYQCVKRETSPGAAGTIAKNLKNLGVGTVYAIGFVGDDGRGVADRHVPQREDADERSCHQRRSGEVPCT